MARFSFAAQLTPMADIAANVFLYWESKILRAAGAAFA